MDWLAACKIPKGASLNIAYAMIEAAQATGCEDCAASRDSLLAAAKYAAKDLLESGCLGSLKHGFQVNFSGRMTPDNSPPEIRQSRFINIEIIETL